jgi:hypothetical protein
MAGGWEVVMISPHRLRPKLENVSYQFIWAGIGKECVIAITNLQANNVSRPIVMGGYQAVTIKL